MALSGTVVRRKSWELLPTQGVAVQAAAGESGWAPLMYPGYRDTGGKAVALAQPMRARWD